MSSEHAIGYMPVDQTYWPDGTPRRETTRPCFCEGPWANVEPMDRPETRLGFEHVEGSNGCVYSVHYHQAGDHREAHR